MKRTDRKIQTYVNAHIGISEVFKLIHLLKKLSSFVLVILAALFKAANGIKKK